SSLGPLREWPRKQKKACFWPNCSFWPKLFLDNDLEKSSHVRPTHGVARMRSDDRMMSGYVIGPSNIQPSHLVLQGGSLKAQALCRSAIAGYFPRRGSQSVEDRLPVGVLECRSQRTHGADCGFPPFIAPFNKVVYVTENVAAHDEVLQFATGSVPVGVRQSLHRRLRLRPNPLLHRLRQS